MAGPLPAMPLHLLTEQLLTAAMAVALNPPTDEALHGLILMWCTGCCQQCFQLPAAYK
jgi:hypothetical protein